MNKLFERIGQDPALKQQLDARLQEALSGAYSVERMHARVDELAAEIEPSARRDWAKWQEKYRSYEEWSSERRSLDDWTDFDGETTFIKNWISARHAHLSEE